MKEKKQKLKQIKVYFSEVDYMNILVFSQAKNISMAEFIRQKINVKIDNPIQPKIKLVYRNTDPRLLYELNKIGNNLNQIAKKLNSKNEFETRAIFEIYQKVMSLK